MPGKPHSPNPCQQKPYVIQKIDGAALDKTGKRISPDAPGAHNLIRHPKSRHF